jgi:glutamine synthetase
MQDVAAAGLDVWLNGNAIREVECLVPDMNGIARGKVLPVARFVDALRGSALYLPSSAFLVALDGQYSGSIDMGFAYRDPDTQLVPDLGTLHVTGQGRASVICDAHHLHGSPWGAAPRQVLKHVLSLYSQRGWTPVVAPEVEFYLVTPETDPQRPVSAAVGCEGRAEKSQHPYDLRAADAFEPFIRQVRAEAETIGLPLDTLLHETGPAQLEINLLHGNALRLADQVIQFKQAARRAAEAQGYRVTFMAKPHAEDAGSSMHLHVSLTGPDGANLFADGEGTDSTMFRSFIGGLQKYLPQLMVMLAPNPNSFRRIRPKHSAPANVEWSGDNRSCGLRVPAGGSAARRVENRLPGADANPYIAIAATLVSGLLGVEEGLDRSPEAADNAYDKPSTLPPTMEDALARFAACKAAWQMLGEDFCETYHKVKSVELDAFQTVVTVWEREHLLYAV